MTTNPTIKAGQVWLNRINQRVRILADDIKCPCFTVVGAREITDGSETLETFMADGKYNRDNSPYDCDLVRLAPEIGEIKKWFNIILDLGSKRLIAQDFHTKEDAISNYYSDTYVVLERAVPFTWKGELPEGHATSKKPAEEHAPNTAW